MTLLRFIQAMFFLAPSQRLGARMVHATHPTSLSPIPYPLASILCCAILTLPAHAASPSLATQVAQSCGVLDTLKTMRQEVGSQIQQAISRNQNVPLEQAAIVGDAMQSAFDKFDSEKIVIAKLAKRMTDKNLQAVATWCQSELGTKIIHLEQEANSPSVYYKREGFIDQLDKQPPPQHRLDLIGKIEFSLHVSAQTTAILENVTVAMIHGANSIVPVEQRQTEETIKKEFAKARAEVQSRTKQAAIPALLFAYSTLSDDELQTYAKYLQTKPAKLFYDTVFEGVNDFMKRVAREMGRTITTEILKSTEGNPYEGSLTLPR